SGLFGFAFGGGVAGVRLASGRVLDRGDHEVAVGDDRRGAFRQLDVRDPDVLADLAALQVDDQFRRDTVGADQDLDRVAHDFQHAALTGVGRFVSVDEGDRDFDLDLFLGADAHQVEVQRTVGNRVELDVLGDDRLRFLAVLQGHQVADQLAGVQRLAEFTLVHGDGHRGLVAAVQDAGHSAFATRGAGAAGAHVLADINVQNDLGHRARLQYK